ncbi:MAG: beta-lactamase family protein [Acidobacteriota bacterium]|nr:beta-lactamase family protein [Acidobacteriota bacterium]
MRPADSMTRDPGDAARFPAAHRLIAEAVAARAFPAAVVEVGGVDGARWREAFGTLTWDAGAPPARPDTIFDLASLTKIVATTTMALQLVGQRRLDLDEPIRERLPLWRQGSAQAVTAADLLAHCSGLPAWRPLYQDHQGRPAFERAICGLPLEYEPRTQSLYSDPGFMLLGFLLEDAADLPLEEQFAELFPDADGSQPETELRFLPPEAWRPRMAPTEVDPWRGRLLVGEVHDENAAALGGVGGHAGLFGTAAAVGRFARTVLRALHGFVEPGPFAQAEILARFVRKSEVPGSSRALGWDTMLTTSSCGHRMSRRAIGHTGFTGTSLWIDPFWGVYIVLLTNRVHPSRTNEAIRTVRPAVHDAIMEQVQQEELVD